MKVVIRVVNKSSSSINVGLDGAIELLTGTHEYKLSQSKADDVVRAASVLESIEVQLLPQEESKAPSTVDGNKALAEMTEKKEALEVDLGTAKDELSLAQGELEKAQGELEKALAELEKSKAANAGGDKNEGATESKKPTKRTTSKTEK